MQRFHTRSRAILGAVLALSTVAHTVPAAAQSGPDPLVGDWQGTLVAGPQKLEIALHVQAGEGGAGGYRATFDSLTQGTRGIPVASVARDGTSIAFEVPAIRARYEATLRPGREGAPAKLDGTWIQGGGRLPLVLTAVDEVSEPRRPQNPEPPFPYAVEQVRYGHDPARGLDESFFVGAPGDDAPGTTVSLAATLTLPKGPGPHPALVTISGSGPQDRDETVFGHKPFLVLADRLTRAGIAVLRFDDRGVGESTGNFESATSRDFADDVRAGLRYLATRDDIDASRLGLLGHSEGGLVAPMVAGAGDDDAARVAFAVLVAPPAVNIRDVILHQSRLIGAASGVPDGLLDANEATTRKIFGLVESIEDRTALEAAIRDAVAERMESLPKEARDDTAVERAVAQFASYSQPWMRVLIDYDPRVALRAMDCDVLAVFGGKDLQVDPAQNRGPLESALAEAPADEVRVVTLENHNHMLQRSETGAMQDYATIEQTMSEDALELIVDWVVRATKSAGR